MRNQIPGLGKHEKRPPGWVGLACYAEGLALCHCYDVDGSKQIDHFDYAKIPPVEHGEYIRNWLEERKLQKSICHYVLTKRDYQLLLVEAPQVEEGEVGEAIRWRLKDLIQIPFDDAAIDIFHLPEDAYRGRIKMLYAVVSSKAYLRDRIRFLTECGLTPKVVDIPEMVLRNISLYLPETEMGSVALLSLRRSSGDMLMYSKDALYLTRQIELGIKDFASKEEGFSLDNANVLDRLALDIQRSLDYYESQLGKGMANKIYFLPVTENISDIGEDIQKLIQVPLENFNLFEYLPIAESKPLSNLEQTYCLPAMGAALRGNA